MCPAAAVLLHCALREPFDKPVDALRGGSFCRSVQQFACCVFDWFALRAEPDCRWCCKVEHFDRADASRDGVLGTLNATTCLLLVLLVGAEVFCPTAGGSAQARRQQQLAGDTARLLSEAWHLA